MDKILQKLEKIRKEFYVFLVCNLYRFLRRSKVFQFQGYYYHYFIHEYNQTWKNERIIEIPIIKRIVDQNSNLDILEVGNVLSHYFNFNHDIHDIIDKYEKDNFVNNADIVNFKFDKKYDLIISISTLEHVGWDEKKLDDKKIFKAIKNLKAHLKKGGKIIFTHPLGYNPALDTYIKEGQLICKEKFLLKRISESNEWIEVSWEQIFRDIRYNNPFPYANGVVIGVMK